MSVISSAQSDSLNFSKPKVFITALFLATHFTYFTMAPRILYVFNMYEPGGILIFPFTFLLSDVITEVYSYAYARLLTWCVLLTLGVFTFFTWLTLMLPTALVNYGYTAVFQNYPKLYFAVAIATLISFSLNNTVVAKLKNRYNSKYFWFRSFVASAIGHACFSAIWVMIFQHGNITFSNQLRLVFFMYVWKMTFEIVATPLATYISATLKSMEKINPNEQNTNFNPFRI